MAKHDRNSTQDMYLNRTLTSAGGGQTGQDMTGLQHKEQVNSRNEGLGQNQEQSKTKPRHGEKLTWQRCKTKTKTGQ